MRGAEDGASFGDRWAYGVGPVKRGMLKRRLSERIALSTSVDGHQLWGPLHNPPAHDRTSGSQSKPEFRHRHRRRSELPIAGIAVLPTLLQRSFPPSALYPGTVDSGVGVCHRGGNGGLWGWFGAAVYPGVSGARTPLRRGHATVPHSIHVDHNAAALLPVLVRLVRGPRLQMRHEIRDDVVGDLCGRARAAEIRGHCVVVVLHCLVHRVLYALRQLATGDEALQYANIRKKKWGCS